MENRNLEHWFLDRQGKLLAWREWRSQLSAMDTASAFKEAAEWYNCSPATIITRIKTGKPGYEYLD